MKKLSVILLSALLILSSLPCGARADVIWEPYDDSFYTDHRSEMLYINAAFTVNGPSEGVDVFMSPDNAEIVSHVSNGDVLNVEYTCEYNGTVWALAFTDGGEGWVQYDCLCRVYDSTLFMEDYADRIVSDSVQPGDYYDYSSAGDDCIVTFWDYPGSESFFGMRTSAEEMEGMFWCDSSFTDEDGLVWGRVGYYRGARNKWICLSDPFKTPEELYSDSFPVRDRREIVTYAGQIAQPSESNAIPVVVAVVVIALAGVALLIFFNRRRKRDGD